MADPKGPTMHRCVGPCKRELELCAANFSPRPSTRLGFHGTCRVCQNARERELYAKARDERLRSEFAALKPEDFDVSVGNSPETPLQKFERSRAAAEKRQEYNRGMGEFAQALHDAAEQAPSAPDAFDLLPEDSGGFIGKLAEQEYRFGNRRLARSVSLAAAHEALALRRFKQAATMYLRDKIAPTGYAAKPRDRAIKRTVVLFLSDLHLGADLSALDNPMPFRAVEEARRLEYVLRQALDYKPQYREHSELLILIGGDIIQGMLLHDMRDGAPLTEQGVIFWRYFRALVGACAQQYPRVRVECQPGNHGRNKLRHPGRATSSKWDGVEWQLYYGLKEMSSGLHNVEFSLPWQAVSVVDLHGAKMLFTHGDTEVKIGHPDSAAAKNAQALDRINSSRLFGAEFAVAAFGHYHTPRYVPRGCPSIVHNGALIPPDGYARAAGFIGEPCGQWIWESVPGYPVGDLRFVEVGPAQDNDERLGQIIVPFRFAT